MAKAKLNLFMAELSGTMGDYVFKKSQTPGEVIIARRPKKSNAKPSAAQTAQRVRFAEASAYAKAALADPVAFAFYQPLAQRRDISVYVVAMGDYLNAPTIERLDLTGYKGNAGDIIYIRVVDNIGLADLDVNITAPDGTPIERGKAAEIETGSGYWNYSATAQVALGSQIFIELNGMDHAGNRVQMTKNLTVGAED